MKLHTVFITHNRLHLTKDAIASYVETVDVPYTLWVVDNASTDGTQDWLLAMRDSIGLTLLPRNRYPGFACNRGFEWAPDDATHFHRADNDFRFLPGWTKEVARTFRITDVGQVGLRTNDEEAWHPYNVGGNMIVKRELWDQGLRYDERPWPELPKGYSEDSYLSPEVKRMGYIWIRVKHSCIAPLEAADVKNPYYRRTFEDRDILDWYE